VLETRTSLIVNGIEVCTLAQYCENIDNENSFFWNRESGGLSQNRSDKQFYGKRLNLKDEYYNLQDMF